MPNGDFIGLDRASLSDYLAPERERKLEENLLRIKGPVKRSARLQALWQLRCGIIPSFAALARSDFIVIP